jgi:hypothetical protein
MFGQAQYSVTDQFDVTSYVSHREQLFLGQSYGSTAYGGGANYGRELWGGRFTTGTIVTESDLGNSGNSSGSMLGILSNAIYLRRIGSWSVSGTVGYTRDVQTLLIAYTSSGYTFTAAASHRFRKLNWNGSAGAAKSVLTEVQGTNTFSQRYSTGVSNSKVGVSAGYEKSGGLGLYTSQGIATLPSGLPPTLLPSSVLYGGTSYSIGVGGMPTRGLTFSGSYVKSRSNTENGSLTSNNETDEANLYLQYKFRKVFFTAGYSRLVQGFSASTLAPEMLSTYYVGISRWFNFF